jgi:hypothetical protein
MTSYLVQERFTLGFITHQGSFSTIIIDHVGNIDTMCIYNNNLKVYIIIYHYVCCIYQRVHCICTSSSNTTSDRNVSIVCVHAVHEGKAANRIKWCMRINVLLCQNLICMPISLTLRPIRQINQLCGMT